MLFESSHEEAAALDAEEQTHNLIGEIMRKRSRISLHPDGNTSVDTYCDSDRVSLLSVDMNTSTLNLNVDNSDAKI